MSRQVPSTMTRPGLFLDRDGVINRDDGFVHRQEDFHFQDGVFAFVRRALLLGYVPVVVTNQSGIARGLYSEADYLVLEKWMLSRFAEEGAPLARSYYCPFLPTATVNEYLHPAHPWRKPAPGMLLAARDDLNLNLGASVLIGDRWSDAQAGAAAGLRNLALLGKRADVEPSPENAPPVSRLTDFGAAEKWISGIGLA